MSYCNQPPGGRQTCIGRSLGGHLYFLSVFVTFLPEAHPVTAPTPQVEKLEAVVTATAEQLALVRADIQ